MDYSFITSSFVPSHQLFHEHVTCVLFNYRFVPTVIFNKELNSSKAPIALLNSISGA